MKTRWHFVLVACLTLVTAGVAADKNDASKTEPAYSILVEPARLAMHLKRDDIRIVDTRPPSEYEKGHIPGAVRVDVNEWKNLAVAEKGLHDADGWSKKVGALGITSDTRVVVYGGNVSDTARIWWLLKYVGVTNASLLNGGWEAWPKMDRPIETTSPKITATEFKPQLQTDRLAEIDAVKSSLKSDNVQVVDTRSDDEFAGGRIPGSVHLEWKHLLAEDGRFKTPKQLQEIFRERGILADETAVCYCQTGGRASVEAFALELAGYPKVKLYMRGWSQWGADSDAPVEK